MSDRIIDEVVGTFERNMAAEHAVKFSLGTMTARETIDDYRIQALTRAGVNDATEAVLAAPLLNLQIILPRPETSDVVCIAGWELEKTMAQDLFRVTGEVVPPEDLPRLRAQQTDRGMTT